MMTLERDLREAGVNMNEAWKQALISVEKFMAAEAVFNDSTDAFRVKHGVPDGAPMTVECLLDRGRDQIWQESVSNCRYHRDRTTMFTNLHNAALARQQELMRWRDKYHGGES